MYCSLFILAWVNLSKRVLVPEFCNIPSLSLWNLLVIVDVDQNAEVVKAVSSTSFETGHQRVLFKLRKNRCICTFREVACCYSKNRPCCLCIPGVLVSSLSFCFSIYVPFDCWKSYVVFRSQKRTNAMIHQW